MESILSYEVKEEDDYYAILGCDETSNTDQINAEFKLRALKEHPDKNLDDSVSGEIFKKLQQAKEVLTDPDKRADYDKWRRSGMAISYTQWKGMGDRVRTMHWASKPSTKPMITGEQSQTAADMNSNTVSRSADVNSYVVGTTVWQRQQGSNLLTKFRNYEI